MIRRPPRSTLDRSSAASDVYKRQTLLIDSDPQANATSGVGYDPRTIKMSIYECIINEADPNDIIMKTETPNMFLLPSHIDLVGAEIEMINLPNRERKMKDVLDKLAGQYDFIIVDCSPSLGLVTINALTAANSCLLYTSPSPRDRTRSRMPSSA